ncbi:nucleotidyltransferase [Carboxydothermus islandicus]|uniref:Nucleotidyltransferase n=1 Tax=Carboxydothermus islandicus TaxID=661089 RepID=A0A1L8CYY9_9THEO|nr:phosphocholine cytidylyltransferase family protein [Carboxydothermus islandicus]GAV24156.1 nucleotidyltransferase [Carboxydothermus islandicus]
MKLVILAAGVGSRLYPLTSDRPKAMIEINGKPLIEKQIEEALKKGIKAEDIYVVGGYQIEVLKKVLPPKVKLIENPDYNTKNNVYSVALLKDHLSDGFILFNSDVVFAPEILDELFLENYPDVLVVDDVNPLDEEDMKVVIENGFITHISKKVNPREAQGEYIGILRFSRDTAQKVINRCWEMVEAGEVNGWYETALNTLLPELKIRPVSTRGYLWTEIDDFKDLEYAREIAQKINW